MNRIAAHLVRNPKGWRTAGVDEATARYNKGEQVVIFGDEQRSPGETRQVYQLARLRQEGFKTKWFPHKPREDPFGWQQRSVHTYYVRKKRWKSHLRRWIQSMEERRNAV